MTLQQALEVAGAISVAVGPLGSIVEAIGVALGWPKLVAVGQRMEAVGADLPKLIRGSRLTNATAADVVKKVVDEK